MSALLAALLLSTGLGRAAEIERLPGRPIEPIAPLANAAMPGVSGLQPGLIAPLAPVAEAQINAFGVPGPGVEAAHVQAMQALADELKTPIFAHGSRQTGVRKTGDGWGKDSDLDLGVIGDVEAFLRAAQHREKFLAVPDADSTANSRRESIVEAVHDGYFVVAPRGYDDLRALAAPWRTDKQLARLEKAPRAPEETFKFSVIGDAEPGRFKVWRWLFNKAGIFQKQLADADRRGTDFILQLGDMVSRGTTTNFTRFFDLLARVAPKTPYLTIIGNHDRHKPHGVTHDRAYRSVFGKTNYFFDRGGYRFVALDSSAGRVTAEQLAWLDETLDTPLKKVVFTHMMPSVIRHPTASGAAFAMGGFKEGSARFADIVSSRGVERVYMGHIHALASREYKGVRYVLTGGGGSPIYPTVHPNNAFHHYLTVEAGPNGLVETVHLPDGRSFPLR